MNDYIKACFIGRQFKRAVIKEGSIIIESFDVNNLIINGNVKLNNKPHYMTANTVDNVITLEHCYNKLPTITHIEYNDQQLILSFIEDNLSFDIMNHIIMLEFSFISIIFQKFIVSKCISDISYNRDTIYIKFYNSYYEIELSTNGKFQYEKLLDVHNKQMNTIELISGVFFPGYNKYSSKDTYKLNFMDNTEYIIDFLYYGYHESKFRIIDVQKQEKFKKCVYNVLLVYDMLHFDLIPNIVTLIYLSL